MGAGGPLPRVKVQLGRDDDHSPPPFGAEVMNEELYLVSPMAPAWR